ncbi:hypothetical protein Bca52824_006988 [Brassica carinata]|uniref:Ubiquitin-like protease family profile domain-containing protein n=1 Tax=Brassica carinata TaxID=52824 RepID=A0A8X7W891_BRACI|nr:hypothetical protein Bca52824_006988 [Brassica carinata]
MAIQGFTHAMVLVTVTACPSIIIKTGVADPLADSTLSSEDIVRRVVERKLVVNIVSAKTVDELGQGDDLYRGLGDKEDTSVDTLHNTWSGGVKADEIRVKKGNAQTSESSDENVPEPVEKDNVHHGVVESDGGRRFSTRTHTSPKRYTPPAPIVRKKEGNRKVPRRMDDNVPPPKRVKKASVESSIPKPPTQEKATFIGGFSAFTPPTPAARETFEENGEAKSNAPSLGSVISIASLDDMFNCTGVCSYEAVDRVVGWIRKRRDSNLSSKFDFILPTFFMELLRNAFTFPMSLRSQFMHRPRWFTQVDFLYTLVLVKDRHWIGMIVDLPMWAIYVVGRTRHVLLLRDKRCPQTDIDYDASHDIEVLSNQRPRELNFLPFPISRLDIPVLLEHPGYSAVVALILLEISTVGKPMIDLSLTEEEVRVAAENYAISMLAMF